MIARPLAERTPHKIDALTMMDMVFATSRTAFTLPSRGDR